MICRVVGTGVNVSLDTKTVILICPLTLTANGCLSRFRRTCRFFPEALLAECTTRLFVSDQYKFSLNTATEKGLAVSFICRI